MEVSNAIEEQVDGILSQAGAQCLTVTTQFGRIDLGAARCGTDFIWGEHSGAEVIIPHSQIHFVQGGSPPAMEDLSLLDYLEAQRLPVRLRFNSQGAASSCWLLTVAAPWLRISSASGVDWIPLAALEMARIESVVGAPSGGQRW